MNAIHFQPLSMWKVIRFELWFFNEHSALFLFLWNPTFTVRIHFEAETECDVVNRWKTVRRNVRRRLKRNYPGQQDTARGVNKIETDDMN